MLSSARMKIATYNVNGVNGRLPRLLEWLNETEPDIVCLHREAYLRNKGFRMDFLLLNDALKARLKATGVEAEFNTREKPSDHAPVWVTVSDT